MNRFYKISVIAPSLLLVVMGCEEVNHQIKPSIVSFETTRGVSREGSGIQEIQVILDHPQESETVISFTLEGSATEESHTRYGFSDYELLTPSPLVMKKGQTTGIIRFQVQEDDIFETDEEYFQIKLSNLLDGNIQLDENTDYLVYTHIIEENDFRLDLLWNEENEEAFPEIDFYLEGYDNTLLFSENHELGKTINVTNADANSSYFLEIGYIPQQEEKAYSLMIYRNALPTLTLFSGFLVAEQPTNAHYNGENYRLQNFRLIKNGNDFVLFK